MAPAMGFIQWNSSDISRKVEVNCFLPTGVLVPIMTTVNTSLAEIKNHLFYEARTYPLYKKLLPPTKYNFMCVSNKGKRETVEDERLTLRDVRPFRPFLKLVERQGVREKEILDSKIKFLMGKTPKEFDASTDIQTALFRTKYTDIALKASRERRQKEWDGRSICVYPPDLYDSLDIPKYIAYKLVDNTFIVSVYKLTGAENNDCVDLHALRDQKAVDVLAKALQIKAGKLKRTVDDISNFTLKVKGKESYLLGNYPLLQYKYIRDCIGRDVKPELSVVPKSTLQVEDYAPMVAVAPSPPPIPPKECLTVWDMNAKFKFKITSATNISIETGTEIGVRAGLYHGSTLLCPEKCSREKQGPSPAWNEYLEFEISMCDIPRMAKLCLTIYAKRKKDSKIPLAWVNMTLFDFRNYLHQGQIKLHAWPVKDNLQHLNPIGTVVSNINTSTSPCLIVEFTQYAKPGTSVVYPPFDKILEKASTLAGNEDAIKHIVRRDDKTNFDLQLLTQREPLAEYSESEKEKIWFFRFECRDNFPNSLPKVLLSIQWNNHEDVARMHALLQSWPPIAPERAMELLDYKYPEKEVRDYAIKCLENFSDSQLHLYLLQLVQVLKYEAYLDCSLAKFLLRRALWNRKIGHSLFWLLRAEMHVPEVSVRFGLLLEAYCRGCVAHMTSLSKQVEAMNKLKAITELLQCQKKAEKEKCIETMKECLQQVTFREAFSDFHSVVDPTCKLKNLRVDQCKMMDSKMRPLWMVYENDDEMGPPTTLIFKNGDDLRQDMLTVQMFKIMDTLWQREGLNLQMTPYAVLPTGDKIGVIEVVTNANTLANIQKSEFGVVRGAFKKEVLLDWLRKKNQTTEMRKRAIETFTMSCAGYCVATYVLGVGDRHSDNIMVKETGELVHIDFGHFLGNFKVKFGVNRERVPFVLSRDFVYVITDGQKSDADKCPEFLRFREICEKAYLILRKHSYLFINLFTMMLSTGLPELRSVKDISYLKKTLGLKIGGMHLDMEEKAALEKFRKHFDEAYKNSTSTSLNWAIHNWAKDNR